MDILEVVWSTNRGGTERACINFAFSLVALGHRVTVWTLQDGLRTAELLQGGVRVVVGPQENPQQILAVASAPGVVHIHSLGVGLEVVESLKRWFPGARFVDTNVFPEHQPFHHLLDASLQLSEFCLFKYRHHTPKALRPPRVTVMPNPVRVEDYRRGDELGRARTRRELAIPDSALVVGRHGQAHANKWSEAYVSTFEALLTKDAGAYLVLINPPGSIQAQVAAAPKGVQDHIRVLPALDQTSEMSRYLSILDVYWHFSEIGETFGYVIVEAMLLALPVITLSTPHRDNTQAEIVNHGKSGYLVLGEKAAVAPTLKLRKDSGLRTRLGATAEADVRRRFDHMAVARSFLNFGENHPAGQLSLGFRVFFRGFRAYGWSGRAFILFFRTNARSWLSIKTFALLVKILRYG